MKSRPRGRPTFRRRIYFVYPQQWVRIATELHRRNNRPPHRLDLYNTCAHKYRFGNNITTRYQEILRQKNKIISMENLNTSVVTQKGNVLLLFNISYFYGPRRILHHSKLCHSSR